LLTQHYGNIGEVVQEGPSVRNVQISPRIFNDAFAQFCGDYLIVPIPAGGRVDEIS
jgi:hypothetical protein